MLSSSAGCRQHILLGPRRPGRSAHLCTPNLMPLDTSTVQARYQVFAFRTLLPRARIISRCLVILSPSALSRKIRVDPLTLSTDTSTGPFTILRDVLFHYILQNIPKEDKRR